MRRGRSLWVRGVAILVIAAIGAPLVPRPAAASPAPCHMPGPAQSVYPGYQQDGASCNHCGQPSCLAMPGCAHLVAVAVAPSPALQTPQLLQLAQPEAPVAHDLASRGPPTPPPNR